MAIRVAINGFGRIGRLLARVLFERFEKFDLVLINDIVSVEAMAHLLKYDSVHGKSSHRIEYEDNFLIVGENKNKRIQVFSEKDPANIPFKECHVDFVVECTGIRKTKESAASFLEAGAPRVMISAPSSDAPMFVMGVNHTFYNKSEDRVFSNASCTTNCLAPIAKVLHNQFGIIEGFMTTIHAATSSNRSVDGGGGRDFRACRSIINNIIPSSTGAAKAVGKVIPELDGKLTGTAFRVPMTDVSAVDLVVRLEKDTSYEEICETMKSASEGPLNGILGYTEDPVVSSDFIGSSYSSIFDAKAGMELNKNFFKLLAWYDNEWGYSNRLADLMEYISS